MAALLLLCGTLLFAAAEAAAAPCHETDAAATHADTSAMPHSAGEMSGAVSPGHAAAADSGGTSHDCCDDGDCGTGCGCAVAAIPMQFPAADARYRAPARPSPRAARLLLPVPERFRPPIPA
jgi:hypothetical protein